MSDTKIYGIKNCDTVRKAVKWLEANGTDFECIDFKKTAPDQQLLESWISQVGIDKLFNKRSTTWKKLPEQQRADADEAAMIAWMQEYPTLIKRPVLEYRNSVHLGFKDAEYQALINS
ncbi:MAG: arsenate reductase [Pseudomonadales bacterium]|nr:arsenate reductase [Pseudomonadales bacterium]